MCRYQLIAIAILCAIGCGHASSPSSSGGARSAPGTASTGAGGLGSPKRALQKRYVAASAHVLPGLQCKLYPMGNSPSEGVTVITDDDGYARFHAVRATVGDAVQRLTLDCVDSTGRPSSFPVNLASDDTFAARPVNLAAERGIDRPGLKADPLSYTQSQLIQTGYGLRPDPVKDAAAYSRWLASASKSGRMLVAKRANMHSHGVTTIKAPWWVGSVLTGDPNYVSTEAIFNVPTGIPGGGGTTSTEISIWNGLGGFQTGSGLIQGGVSVQTTPTVASYGSWREYCCGDGNSNGYGGAFVPNPGDKIYSQEWYCDANGNLNLNGGYGCTYLHDLTSGAILSCTSATGSPCWSVKALPLCSANPTAPNCMTLGFAAEFVIENQSPQVLASSTAFTDFTPMVTISGSAYSSRTNSYSKTISTDSAVSLLTDFTSTTTHVTVSLGTIDQTYFSVSPSPQWPAGALDVFWIGPDRAIDTTWANPQVDDGAWHQPFPISPSGAAHPNSAVAAVTRLAGAMDIFWVGPDGAVATTWENPQVDGANWHTAFPISPPQAARSGSPLVAVTRFDGALDVFWIGPDGGIGTTWANPRVASGAWHSPFRIAPPGAA
jgi:hypothetical protein